jgi:hypothetical protein
MNSNFWRVSQVANYYSPQFRLQTIWVSVKLVSYWVQCLFQPSLERNFYLQMPNFLRRARQDSNLRPAD